MRGEEDSLYLWSGSLGRRRMRSRAIAMIAIGGGGTADRIMLSVGRPSSALPKNQHASFRHLFLVLLVGCLGCLLVYE